MSAAAIQVTWLLPLLAFATAGCAPATHAKPTEVKQMTVETLMFPSESIRCERGDYVLHRGTGGRTRVYRVEDLVKLSRLVPFGKDALTLEELLLDSERPAFMGEIHLLLTAFDHDFASPEEATRAIEAGELGSSTAGLCIEIRHFPLDTSQVYRQAR